MIRTMGKRGMGWIPDYPDFRDYTERTDEVKSVLQPTGVLKAKSPPVSVDLREWCSPIEDQGGLGSCTAHAGVGVIEYYERKSFEDTWMPHDSFSIRSPAI